MNKNVFATKPSDDARLNEFLKYVKVILLGTLKYEVKDIKNNLMLKPSYYVDI